MSLPVHKVESLATVIVGDIVIVEGDEAHHAVAVRRLQTGEHVVLTDGAGRAATGVVAATGKRRLEVSVAAVETVSIPHPEITVIQALPKGDRGELAVELLTEIGVQRIVPWAADRSVAIWRGDRATKGHAKWQATAREAAKQSRRWWHPEIAPLASTREVIALVDAADLAVVLHEEAEDALPAPGAVETLLLIVGPEGGLSSEEVAAFRGAGAVCARLGPEVLRTSTAGLAACAALLAQTPRWAARSR